jgi:hypothetical protein
MEGGGAAAGATVVGIPLGDIGDWKESSDLWAIGSAAVVGTNLAVVLNKVGGLGGITLNTYFDTFGLEGILANASWIVILFQAARWIYTTFYTDAGKAWSPFVFLCVLLAVQLVHDVIFYYGLLQQLPSGRNEMVDALKRYANENGKAALGTHSMYFLLTGVAAMLLKEMTFLASFLVVNVALYFLPFAITMVGPRPPPPPPEKKKNGYQPNPAWGTGVSAY